MDRVRVGGRATGGTLARVTREPRGAAVWVALALAAGVALGAALLGVVRGAARADAPYVDPFLRGAGAEWLPPPTPVRLAIPDVQDAALHLLLAILLALTLLTLAVALVSLLVLVLARAAGRRPEVALRAALGAGRGRLAVQAGQVEASLVAAGIKIALITTATGLVIAIPINIAYNFFVSRIDQLIVNMEEGTNAVVNLLWDVYPDQDTALVGERPHRTDHTGGTLDSTVATRERPLGFNTQGTIVPDKDTLKSPKHRTLD